VINYSITYQHARREQSSTSDTNDQVRVEVLVDPLGSLPDGNLLVVTPAVSAWSGPGRTEGGPQPIRRPSGGSRTCTDS
jgi:hypothetical protein